MRSFNASNIGGDLASNRAKCAVGTVRCQTAARRDRGGVRPRYRYRSVVHQGRSGGESPFSIRRHASSVRRSLMGWGNS